MKLNIFFTIVKLVVDENQKFRSDGKCGEGNPLPNGSPAQCNPSGKDFCCSKYGFCGGTDEHCQCDECIDYKNPQAKGIYFKNGCVKNISSNIFIYMVK